jgi:hypothetical protein
MHQRAPICTLSLVASSAGDLASWNIDRGTVSIEVYAIFCHGEAGKMEVVVVSSTKMEGSELR